MFRNNHKRYSAARAENGRSFSRLMTKSPTSSSNKAIGLTMLNQKLAGRISKHQANC